jgi:hypothetical protein
MSNEPDPYSSANMSQHGPAKLVPPDRRQEYLHHLMASLVGFSIGVLGNLVAGRIQEEWLNPFTRPLLFVIALLTLAGFGADILLKRLSQIGRPIPGIKNQYLARGLVLMIIAFVLATTLSWMLLVIFPWARDCSEVKPKHLELYLGTPRAYSVDNVIQLDPVDIFNRGNLTGRLIFTNPAVAAHCDCEWWGETNQSARQKLTGPKDAKDCGFSIPLDDGVKEITLRLAIGEQVASGKFEPAKYYDISIKVRPKTKLQ